MTDKSSLLIAFNMSDDQVNSDEYEGYKPSQLPKIHDGKNRVGHNTWLVKGYPVLDSLKFACHDYQTHSMLIKKEYVESVNEFTENRMLVYADPDFLILQDWKVMHTVQEPVSGNI